MLKFSQLILLLLALGVASIQAQPFYKNILLVMCDAGVRRSAHASDPHR
jgi:hypothetical protein